MYTQVKRFDELSLVAIAFLAFLGFNLVKDQTGLDGVFKLASAPVELSSGAAVAPVADGLAESPAPVVPVAAVPEAAPGTGPTSYDPNLIVYPYAQYIMTQGPHGADYGHMAIDISGGKGAEIKSPITGMVTARFVDEYGNTQLILENERFVVTMLHGNFAVQVGEFVNLGQLVGHEGNNGYTLDAYGQLCAGRDCGYHTHLNVYDKVAFSNVNPLDVLQPLP